MVADYERQIYTLPVGMYTLKATAYEAEDCTGEAVFNFEHNFEVKLGSDDLWDPAPPVFDITVKGTALLIKDSVVQTEKLEPEGYYLVRVPKLNQGTTELCEDEYGYSETYNTNEDVTCLDFSVTNKESN